MKRKLYAIAGCILVLLIMVFSFDPSRIPSLFLVVPFILLFIILLLATSMLLAYGKIDGPRNNKIAALCAGLPILVLVLQSIGQLTARDVLTVAILFVISLFYVVRSSPAT